MWPDRVSNPRPLALESDALPTAPRGSAIQSEVMYSNLSKCMTHLSHNYLVLVETFKMSALFRSVFSEVILNCFIKQ